MQYALTVSTDEVTSIQDEARITRHGGELQDLRGQAACLGLGSNVIYDFSK